MDLSFKERAPNDRQLIVQIIESVAVWAPHVDTGAEKLNIQGRITRNARDETPARRISPRLMARHGGIDPGTEPRHPRGRAA